MDRSSAALIDHPILGFGEYCDDYGYRANSG
jgi:hypothetical protein